MSGPWEKYAHDGPWSKYATEPNPEPTLGQQAKQAAGNVLAGAVRGAGSIGATLLYPVDKLTDIIKGDRGPNVTGLVLGKQPLSRNEERRKAMDEALASMGAETDSFGYGAGKLGAEIAGTLGVGGAAANMLGRVPSVAAAAPNVLNAIRTAGMQGGGMATRAAGGAIAGGASAGLVNPEDAITGALVGGALPGILQVAGGAGRVVGSALKGSKARANEQLARALGVNSAADAQVISQQLQAAREIVPGSAPTVAQTLRSPQAGILERVVSDSPGGVALKERYAQQAMAREVALNRVAPVAPTGANQARADTGKAIADWATGARGAARAKTSEFYNQVPADEAMLYLPELGGVRDQYFGPGVFGSRGAVDEAVNTARRIGTEEVGGIVPTRAKVDQPRSLAQAVRKLGGLSLSENDGLRGEIVGLGGDFKNLVRRNGGVSPAKAAETLKEAGYLPNEDVSTLIDALRNEATGRAQFSTGNLPENAWAAARDAAMGDAPAAGTVAKKVTLKDFEDLRKSIGAAQRSAAVDPARASEAAALSKMRQSMDDRINEVVRGDGAIDENLPIEWANALSAARQSKADEVARFGTGPQARMFRGGSDGQPVLQGGEVAAAFWGNRPGLADDVKSFKRLVDGNTKLLGQFRSMVTTEGASTADASGNLGAKFVRWVDNQLPGLKEAFEPDQVKSLQRIAQDIKRSMAGASAGMSRGSNTYQNASNALSLGLLDSPLASVVTNRVPLAGPALGWFRETSRNALARDMAELMADPAAAANALRVGQPGTVANALANPELQQFLLRAAPAANPFASR